MVFTKAAFPNDLRCKIYSIPNTLKITVPQMLKILPQQILNIGFDNA